jgi:hypothetical protein
LSPVSPFPPSPPLPFPPSPPLPFPPSPPFSVISVASVRVSTMITRGQRNLIRD